MIALLAWLHGPAATPTTGRMLKITIPTHQQIFVRLSVLGTHHHIDDRIDTGGQVDEQVANYVHKMVPSHRLKDFVDGNWQVADDKRNKNHQNHFQQPAVFSGHSARVHD